LSSPSDVRIYVVDDHAVVREGIRHAVSGLPGLRLVGSASTPEQALAELGQVAADVVILDLVFDGQARFDLIRSCRRLLPTAGIIVFSSLLAHEGEERCLRAGADAYVSKERELADLAGAVQRVARRLPIATSPARSAEPMTDMAHLAGLTARERQIAALLAKGATIAQISLTIGISKKTAAVHADNIRRKLGCANSRQLVTMLAKMDERGA
jgi:DNA-binding NarL/FixJ family response regulator